MDIKVLIADDHEVVRSGLVSMLAGTNIHVVAEAASGASAIEQAVKHRPDVVLMDIRMNEMDGLDALDRIHNELPETRVVMLSTYDNPTYVARAVALGAADYVLKGSPRSELISVINAAAEGATPTAEGKLQQVAQTMAKGPELIDDADLTSREVQVLKHLALGLSNKEIARSLEISVETVKEHVQNILRKIGATDRTHAAVWAVRKGLA